MLQFSQRNNLTGGLLCEESWEYGCTQRKHNAEVDRKLILMLRQPKRQTAHPLYCAKRGLHKEQAFNTMFNHILTYSHSC